VDGAEAVIGLAQIGAWLVGSKAGRGAVVAAAVLAAIAWLRWDAGRDARRDAERAALERNMERRNAADEAAGRFRGDGAQRRLRDGQF
jgi:hypothetical protein